MAPGGDGKRNDRGGGQPSVESRGTPDEDEQERLTRNFDELLQELRVTQTGVQLLTGFLLTIPFTQRFEDLDRTQRSVYLVVVCGSILATAFILSPVAHHRILFRQRQRKWIVEAANQAARIGLTLVALTTCGVLFLIFDVVAGRPWSIVAGAAALTVFLMVWVGLPLVRARRP